MCLSLFKIYMVCMVNSTNNKDCVIRKGGATFLQSLNTLSKRKKII